MFCHAPALISLHRVYITLEVLYMYIETEFNKCGGSLDSDHMSCDMTKPTK